MNVIEIMLLPSRRYSFLNCTKGAVISAEHNATEIRVQFPQEYESFSKRVDFVTSKGNPWTEKLFVPEFEEYAEDFDKNVFSFTLPNEVTIQGELKMQFVAYMPDDTLTVVPFDVIPIYIEYGLTNFKKNGRNNPDLLVLSYNQSTEALMYSEQAKSFSLSAEQKSDEALSTANEALQTAESVSQTAQNAETTALDAKAVSAAAAHTADMAYTAAGNSILKADDALAKSEEAKAISQIAAEKAESALISKVDKVQGKGLSTNDYTDTEKQKLLQIEANAQVNVQSDWSEDNAEYDAYIKNKPAALPADGGNADTVDGKHASEFATAEQGIKADNAVPNNRKVNGKSLSADITLVPSDLGAATASQGAKADTALQSFSETDPTVPSWAKQTNKPSYTPGEVGAEPVFSKNTAFNKNFGSSANTVCEGSDSRLSDSRMANGGNADTVDGKHASDFATSEQGTKADNAVGSVSAGEAVDNGKIRLSINEGGVAVNVDAPVKGLGSVAFKESLSNEDISGLGTAAVKNMTATTPSAPPTGNNNGAVGSVGVAFGDHAHPQNYEGSPSNIKMNGTESAGVLNTVPRADHVHPRDTGLLDISRISNLEIPTVSPSAINAPTQEAVVNFVANAKRVGQLQEFGLPLNQESMDAWKLLYCDGSLKVINTYPKLAAFLGSIGDVEQITVDSGEWAFPVRVGTNFYFSNAFASTSSETTTIGKLDTLTKVFSRVTVPSGKWNQPVVVGTNIYYGINDTSNATGTIGKFDTLTQTGIRINVPFGGWSRPVVFGTDIYFGNNYQSSSTIIHKLDTLTDTGSTINVPSGYWLYPVVVGTSVYYTPDSSSGRTSIGKFDTLTQTGSIITVPSGVWYNAVVVGTDIYCCYGTTTTVSKFNTSTDTGSIITVPSGYWGASSVVVGTNIYYGTNSSTTNTIGKFDTSTETGTRVIVPTGRWTNPALLGSDIYFGNDLASTFVCKFDTLTQTGGVLMLPSGQWRNPFVFESDVYFSQNGGTLVCRLSLYSRSVGLNITAPSAKRNVAFVYGTNIYFCNYSTGTTIYKFNTLTRTGINITVPSAVWDVPIIVGTNVYFTNGGSSSFSTTSIRKFNLLTDTGSLITVPSGHWCSPVLLGTDIYYGGLNANTTICKFDTLTQTGSVVGTLPTTFGNPVVVGTDIYFNASLSTAVTSIGKFNTLTQEVSSVTVPSGIWYRAVVVGTDIYYGTFGATGTSIGKFDTLTQTGSRVVVPSSTWSYPFVVETDIYFGYNSTGSVICKFNISTQTGSLITVPSYASGWYNPLLVGTTIYYSAGDNTTTIGKLDTLTDTGSLITVPSGYWGSPFLAGQDVYFRTGTNSIATIGVLTFGFKLPEQTSKYIQS